MGAEEVPVRSRLGAVRAWTLALALAPALLVAGCGEGDPPAAPASLIGPTSPQGDIDPSAATLRASDGFTSLVNGQVRTRGDKDALIIGQVELTDAQAEPRFRLLVDGEPERAAEVSTVADGGAKSAVVSCACRLPTGDHVVVLEGTAESGIARVGARSLIVFPDVQLDDAGALALSGSALETDPVEVTPEGATLVQTQPSNDVGGEPLVVLAAIRSPRAGIGSETVRIEALVGDEPADELAVTDIPSGRIVAYLDSDGAEVGDPVTIRGYVTAGRTTVGVTSVAVCPCELAR